MFTIQCLFSFYDDPSDPSKLDEYYLELEAYFPPQVRSIDLGIWLHDELVGSIMMAPLKDSATTLEFGYWISEQHEGKGIITRCISALMDYAIDNMSIQRFALAVPLITNATALYRNDLGFVWKQQNPKGKL